MIGAVMVAAGDDVAPSTRSASSRVATEDQAGQTEEYRRSRDVLASSTDTDIQELVNLLQRICDVELAAVSIYADAQFHYVVTAGIDPLACEAEDTMCQDAMSSDHTIVVPDTTQDERFSTSPYIDGRLMALRFYASAPLSPLGTMVGRLCLFDSAVKHLSPLQEQTLGALAEGVTSILKLRLTERDLADDPPNPEPELDRVMSIAAQVSHDLRSPLTALSG